MFTGIIPKLPLNHQIELQGYGEKQHWQTAQNSSCLVVISCEFVYEYAPLNDTETEITRVLHYSWGLREGSCVGMLQSNRPDQYGCCVSL